MIHDPHLVQEFGSVKVHTDSSTGVREIIIDSMSQVEDILKLAHALSQEPGTLMDRSMGEQFDIVKGTTAGSIVSYIQELFRIGGGQTLRLLYKPTSNVGGAFVGPLRGLFTRPLMHTRQTTPGTQHEVMKQQLLKTPIGDLSHYGGKVKVSDIAGGIAGVAGGISVLSPLAAPLALPIAAVSGIVSAIGKLFKF